MWLNKQKTRLRSGCPQCGNARVEGEECFSCKSQNHVVITEKCNGEPCVLVDFSNIDRLEIPSLWRRAVATSIDLALLWILQWSTIPYGLLLTISPGHALDNIWILAGLALTLLWYATIEWWLYAAVFESSPFMATPGKFAMGLITLDTNGRQLSFFRASKRILSVSFSLGILAILSVCAIMLNRKAAEIAWSVNLLIMPACLLFALGNTNRQTLFDFACGRIVLFRKSLPEAMQRVRQERLKGLKKVVATTMLLGLVLNTVAIVELARGAYLFINLENALTKEGTDKKSLEIATLKMQQRYPHIGSVYSSMSELVKTWNKPLQADYLKKAIRFTREEKETSRLPKLLIDHALVVSLDDKQWALKELDEAESLGSEEPATSSEIHEAKSEIFAAAGETRSAIDEVTLAIAEDPLKPRLYSERARLRTLIQEAGANLDNQRAEEVRTMNFSSLSDIRMVNYKERLNILQKVTEIAPESITAKAYLAKAKYARLDYDAESISSKEGLKEIDYLSALYPRNFVVLQIAAEISDNEGNSRKAISVYTRLIEVKPSVKSYLRRGDLYESIGNHKMAVNDYTQAIELDNGDSGNWNTAQTFASRAISNAKLGQFEKSAEDYTSALDLSPGNTDWLNSRANMYEMLGQWDNAVTDLDEAIAKSDTLEYTKAELKCARARMLMHQGETQEALADCNASLDITPDNVEALYIRAKLYDKLGRKKEADADRETIRSTDLSDGQEADVEAETPSESIGN